MRERLWKRLGLPRRGGKGRRFGFVKFKEVNEVETLSESLRDVWLSTYKLRVNRSRFASSDSKELVQQENSNQRSPTRLEQRQVGRSFRNAVLGIKESVMKVPVNEALCKELQGSMVGTLACEKDVRRIQTTMHMEGFQSIFVTHMGGNMALIRSSVEGDVERMLRSKKDSLNYYFSKLKPWNPGLLAVQREVWIQVYGIPTIYGEKSCSKCWELNSVCSWISTARLRRWQEGVHFKLWVVKEIGRQRGEVVLGGEREEQGSVGFPSVASDDVVVGRDVEGFVNSSDDEAYGEDMEVDRSKASRGGGRLKADRNSTFGWSGYVGNEETLLRKAENVLVLAASADEVDSDKCLSGGVKEIDDVVYLEGAGGGTQTGHGLPAPSPECGSLGQSVLCLCHTPFFDLRFHFIFSSLHFMHQ
ncbi:hypothetical protein TSUD_395550 [Trifolium subterraneum]|uniref:Uncharacterized protein n=1 Tax=Trifolium subterraneum TaxID=3900 RepID=A0A2Z6N6B3_TRISU|nr:hypothetical protein TSUD_395550 [Trifolium subterraneum]